MKYIVFILVVSAVVSQMADAQGMLNANLSGSVSGSIEIGGHYMNFTGEVRPRRDVSEMDGPAVADGEEPRYQLD